jgi:hypothetical protein
MLLSLNAFFPTMPRNLGRPLGAYNCSNRELTFDLLLFDILSRIPASGVCEICPNSAGFTAMRITGRGGWVTTAHRKLDEQLYMQFDWIYTQ